MHTTPDQTTHGRRRASQSHPPPADQPRNNGDDAGGRKEKGAAGGWRGLLKAALSHGDDQTAASAGDDDRQAPQLSSDLRKNRSIEDGSGGSGGGDVGGVEGGSSDNPGENVTSPRPTAAPITSAVGRAPDGTQEARGGNGDIDQAERREAGTGGERQQAARQPGHGESGGNELSSEAQEAILEADSQSTERGGGRGEGGETIPAAGERGVDATGSQKGQRARRPEDEQGTGPESRQQEVVYRPPPEEFWRSVEGRALSSRELEGVLDGVTEEEAERYLRDKGMVDKEGNFKPPPSKR